MTEKIGGRNMVTPMQFIYEAAQATPKVITPSGKEILYTFPEIPECEDDRCWLCGGLTHGHGTPRKKTIKPTFTNHDIAKYPPSDSICEACTWGLSQMSLRNYSIVATKEGLLHPSKLQIRDMLIKPPESPFVFTIAISGQKWLHILARVNYSSAIFYVQYEETQIQIKPIYFHHLIEPIEKLYNGGFTKDEIRTGNYQIHKILAFGIEALQDIEIQLSNARGSRIFELAVDMAKKEDK
jgi:hypothetical protein